VCPSKSEPDPEVLDERSNFCAQCGNPFHSEDKGSDFVIAAGILAIIAAAFSITAGAIGITDYYSYATYYASVGRDMSVLMGFLLFGSFAFGSSVFGFAGGVVSLERKRFRLAVLGTVLVAASTVFTFVIVGRYGYGMGYGLLLSGIPPIALSLTSTFFLIMSKAAFSESGASDGPASP